MGGNVILKMGMTVFAAAAMATGAQAATIQVNFGNNSGVANWNELGSVSGSIDDLIDSTGASTGYSLLTDTTADSTQPGDTDGYDRFNGTNPDGTSSPTGDAALYFPGGVTATSFYGNTLLWAGEVAPLAVLTLSNLDSGLTYDLTFGAARIGATDNRTTEYLVQGAGAAAAAYLNPSDNFSEVAQVFGITPDANGEITISITDAVANVNQYDFYYLGGMVIETTVVPEPASLGLLAAGGVMLLRRRRA